MELHLNKFSYVIFDLDDTLYKEIEFLKSGFYYIVTKLPNQVRQSTLESMVNIYQEGGDALQYLLVNFNNYFKSKIELLNIYRNHIPIIQLSKGVAEFLEKLKENKINIGLITDGRSSTQRNKIKTLGLENYFSDIIISEEFGSEKPSMRNFDYFHHKYKNYKFIYIADNPKKDFISPNKLGWLTICLLDDGCNIHKQTFDLPIEYLPKRKISSFFNLEITYES